MVTSLSATEQRPSSPQNDREYWLGVVRRLADPVLGHLAEGTLKARMPVEQAPGADRRSVTHLEALGRLLAGMAPWLELGPDGTEEGRLREQYGSLARRAIAHAVDPASPDFLNFTKDRQPLVDAAFLGQALLRAPKTLRDGLDDATKRHLIAALESSRVIVPNYNNWLLFTATVEAALKQLGAWWDPLRVDYAVRQHEQWYKGDGAYGDGADFHWDYYNSFVIHPMLLDVLDACADENAGVEEPVAACSAARATLRRDPGTPHRAGRVSFPAIGRSLAYRFGAFHLLAQMALRRALPDGVTPAQVRGALTAVIRRSHRGAGNIRRRAAGCKSASAATSRAWARPTSRPEACISARSACCRLGLAATDEFWSAAAQPWTSARAWSGQAFPIDHAL